MWACLKHRNGVLPTDRAAPLVRLETSFRKCSSPKPRWLPTRLVAAERAYRNPRLAGRQRNRDVAPNSSLSYAFRQVIVSATLNRSRPVLGLRDGSAEKERLRQDEAADFFVDAGRRLAIRLYAEPEILQRGGAVLSPENSHASRMGIRSTNETNAPPPITFSGDLSLNRNGIPRSAFILPAARAPEVHLIEQRLVTQEPEPFRVGDADVEARGLNHG